MKLLSIEQTTLLKLGIFGRADGQLYFPDMVSALQKEFKFLTVPQLGSADKGLEFGQGKFKNFGIESFALYSDGVVVKSNTDSKRLDELISYMENWAKKHFGASFVPSHDFGSVYESNLVVQFEFDVLEKAFPKLSKVSKTLKSQIAIDSRLEANFAMTGIVCSAVSNHLGNFRPAPFRLERKAGSDPKLFHFFSCAPIKTASHLELLSEFASSL